MAKFWADGHSIEILEVWMGCKKFNNLIKSFHMDQYSPLFSQKNTKNNLDHFRQTQAFQSIKNCIEYIFQIFKFCHITPKHQANQIISIADHCSYAEKLLKKIVSILPKHMIAIQTHNKAIKQYEQIHHNYQELIKQQREYKCQISVLENKLLEAEKRQQQLIEAIAKDKQSEDNFEKKLSQVRKQSQIKLQRLVKHINKQQNLLTSRKQSLPTIIHHSSKPKGGPKSSILLLGTPSEQEKTKRLVDHLKKKY